MSARHHVQRVTPRKPVSYRGFEIDVYRERSMGCGVLTYYSVFRESDMLEVTSGFSYDTSPIPSQRACYKRMVDRILDEGDPDEMLNDSCESISQEGDVCFLPGGHKGNHVDRPCNGTCDSCECAEWTDADARETNDDLPPP